MSAQSLQLIASPTEPVCSGDIPEHWAGDCAGARSAWIGAIDSPSARPCSPRTDCAPSRRTSTCSTSSGSRAMPPCNAGEVVVEPRHDAYGQLLLAALEGDDVFEIVERDDGFISASVMVPKPTEGQDRHLKLALRKERPVVGRILVERQELGKARSHCAGLRIERRIMPALRFIKPIPV